MTEKIIKKENIEYKLICNLFTEWNRLEATAKIWKCLALIFFIMTIVSITALFI